MKEQSYDVVVIGAGMAGLAAGIRVALSGKSVLLLERHEAPGGLNSFYRQDGRLYDVGLHALTNYADAGARRAPLNKIFRQLRIPRKAFDLNPQVGSRIAFPEVSLAFTNDLQVLESEIELHFPGQIDAFRRLVEFVRERDATALESSNAMAGPFLEEWITDPLLREMILCPVMYYGSSTEDDLNLDQFVILFRSLYLEGFGRPLNGVRTIIQALLRKYKELGGERKMRCGVRELRPSGNRITEIELENGSVIKAKQILSSAGLVETNRLCGIHEKKEPVGRLSFVETMSVYDRNPAQFGWEDTITFFSTARPFHYHRPEGLVDDRSGVICIPNHYEYDGGKNLSNGMVRITAMANYDLWKALSEDEYLRAKEEWFDHLQSVARSVLPETREEPDSFRIARDMFTPTTVEKFTGHLSGAVYGSSMKVKDGRTPFENLYLCGTDQGFLGIVGAMLSGISIANRYVLQVNS